MTAETVAVILAAGAGERTALGRPKAFITVGGRSILEHAVEGAAACPRVASIVVAVPEGYELETRDLVTWVSRPVVVVTGGDDRQASVRRALGALPHESDAVICHDAARPFATPRLFAAVLDALDEAEGAVPVLPVLDTVKRVREGYVSTTLPRDDLVLSQTPQAFVTTALMLAHERAHQEEERSFTDDAAVMEWAGYRIRTVPGEPDNFKITSTEDLARAELSLAGWQRRGNGDG